jgi:enoyl-CoA hydratase
MSSPAEPVVRVDRRGPVALLTLNRPEAMNSLSAELRAALLMAVKEADADPAVRVIVIRGAGPKAFCAGADIKEFVPPGSVAGVRAEKHARSWTDALAGARKPTIAAIHGYCLGGGLELALACDIRIASTDATFAMPEVRLAIIPGAGGTQRLSRVVGLGHALRMILTGDRIDAQQAYRIGLVTDLVAPGELETAALALAESIGRNGPVALAYAKEAVRRGFELPLAEGLKLELDLSTLLQTTRDRDEGAQAFREKRKPVFKGE